MMKRNILTGLLVVGLFGLMGDMQAMQAKVAQIGKECGFRLRNAFGCLLSESEKLQVAVEAVQSALCEIDRLEQKKNVHENHGIAAIGRAIVAIEALLVIHPCTHTIVMQFSDDSQVPSFSTGSFRDSINCYLSYFDPCSNKSGVKVKSHQSSLMQTEYLSSDSLGKIKTILLANITRRTNEQNLEMYIEHYYPGFMYYLSRCGDVMHCVGISALRTVKANPGKTVLAAAALAFAPGDMITNTALMTATFAVAYGAGIA